MHGEFGPTDTARIDSASFAFEMSVSRPAPISLAEQLHDYARDVATRVPFPVIFIAGTALGILLATVFVTIGHREAPMTATMTMSVAAPPPAWAPLPVVTIHPAPPEPVAAPEASPVADPVAAVAAVPRVVTQRAVLRAPRRVVVAPLRKPTSPTAHDLLANAL